MAQATSQKGFTLIELMTVVAIVALLATLAIPNLMGAKLSTNESAAIATLRTLSTVQVNCANRGIVDIDNDGCGEFGFFRELAGEIPPRNTPGLPLVPPLLAASFRQVNAGIVTRQGYSFVVYLPDSQGVGLHEAANNYAGVAPNMAEQFWCVYAWPTSADISGHRVMFTNQRGDILWSNNSVQDYSGTGSMPPADACFSPGAAGKITGMVVVDGSPAQDGGIWRVLN